MSDKTPILVRFRRDLRLSDNAALAAACASGHPVIPVFLNDDLVGSLRAAPKWRLGLGVANLADHLAEQGSRLILRRGANALTLLQELITQTGAGAVYWSRLYDPETVTRDSDIKQTLKSMGVEVRSFGGHLMFEPWTIATKTGGYYKVYTPFWNRVRNIGVDAPRPAPVRFNSPANWPDSDELCDWNMGAAMHRGAAVVRPFVQLGERAAQARLTYFIENGVATYRENRDIPSLDGTSNLSENLALGEITPHQCWHAGTRALAEGKAGAETFLKELVWREFAYHLMYHTPHILTRSWREEWQSFDWKSDPSAPEVLAWKQGRTGIAFVDAAMRELYVTGRMHNRGRMIVASYLTKHLRTDWRIGMAWFEACLIDWDPASNAMGWQWSAGCGPDATPYFRVFNPETQLDKFDKDRRYADRWIAEGNAAPHKDALCFFDAVPKTWGMRADASYPDPIVTAAEGRKAALAAYEKR
ncbi:MAG: deoxyribodipyrimidine photo-lyase [Sulfitobacter sp.]